MIYVINIKFCKYGVTLLKMSFLKFWEASRATEKPNRENAFPKTRPSFTKNSKRPSNRRSEKKEQKKKKRLEEEEERKMGLERLHRCLLIKEILLKLNIESLSSLACVSKAMNFSVSQALPFVSSLDLSVQFSHFLNFGWNYYLGFVFGTEICWKDGKFEIIFVFAGILSGCTDFEWHCWWLHRPHQPHR